MIKAVSLSSRLFYCLPWNKKTCLGTQWKYSSLQACDTPGVPACLWSHCSIRHHAVMPQIPSLQSRAVYNKDAAPLECSKICLSRGVEIAAGTNLEGSKSPMPMIQISFCFEYLLLGGKLFLFICDYILSVLVYYELPTVFQESTLHPFSYHIRS